MGEEGAKRALQQKKTAVQSYRSSSSAAFLDGFDWGLGSLEQALRILKEPTGYELAVHSEMSTGRAVGSRKAS